MLRECDTGPRDKFVSELNFTLPSQKPVITVMVNSNVSTEFWVRTSDYEEYYLIVT